jgi:hypothetical protein
MGGVLNEDVEGSNIPVDVRADLLALGIRTPDDLVTLIDDLAASPGRTAAG